MGHALDQQPRGGNVAGIRDEQCRDVGVQYGFHRTITTFVPFPGVLSMWNSSDSRLAPESPRPRPPPVV